MALRYTGAATVKVIDRIVATLCVFLACGCAFLAGAYFTDPHKTLKVQNNEPDFKFYPVRSDIDCLIVDYKEDYKVVCFTGQVRKTTLNKK